MQNESIVTEAIKFRTLLTQESDRACALMAGSYLDLQLSKLLRTVFVDESKVVDDLIEPSKPVGTFSAKIDLAYLLGLLSKGERRDLHLIRKIRNDFGHDPTPIDFSTPIIASRARELTHTWHEDFARPRAHFTSAVMAILATITVALVTKKHADKKPNTADKRNQALAEDKELFEGFESALESDPEDAIEFVEKMRQRTLRDAELLQEHILAKNNSTSH